jgi:hypothetical protein
MRLTSTGLGIGTSDPQFKLDIRGNQNSVLTGAYLRNDSAGASAYAGLALTAFGNSWSWRIGSAAANSNALELVLDVTSPSVKATFDTSGNLGLGVTPSAWGSSIRSIDIGPGTALTNANSTTDTWLSSNAYYTTQWLYKNAQAASYYQQVSGAHSWHTAPSWDGTGSNAITFTQAMTLDASGNLGIVTTSPASYNAAARQLVVGTTSGNNGITVAAGSDSQGSLFFADGTGSGAQQAAGYLAYVHSTDAMLFGTGNTERARIDSSGNVGIGTTTPTAKLHVNGSLRYMSSISGGGGLNVQNVVTANNNSANSIGSINVAFCVICISQGNGQTLIPLFLNAGGGVAWAGSLFDPGAGSFVYGAGPTVSFATEGAGGNSYTLSMAGADGIGTITRTAGSAAYTVTVLYLFEN